MPGGCACSLLAELTDQGKGQSRSTGRLLTRQADAERSRLLGAAGGWGGLCFRLVQSTLPETPPPRFPDTLQVPLTPGPASQLVDLLPVLALSLHLGSMASLSCLHRRCWAEPQTTCRRAVGTPELWAAEPAAPVSPHGNLFHLS